MSNYLLSDFEVGDGVFKEADPNQIMIVVKLHEHENKVECNWYNNQPVANIHKFCPTELIKYYEKKNMIMPDSQL